MTQNAQNKEAFKPLERTATLANGKQYKILNFNGSTVNLWGFDDKVFAVNLNELKAVSE